MNEKEVEEMMNRIVADTIVKILTTSPTDKALNRNSITEKRMAWIELHEDVLDEAYDMSKEYREYE
mgnify:FL=1|jgi:hypothetical protein|tara:strand:- start:663 stop:860 length:198 start_codon:yes stop_codon:yes gene_type:complete